MSESFTVSGAEITTFAKKLDDIGFDYGCPAVSRHGSDASATGHVELSAQLPGFCDFVSEVLNALTSNLGVFSEQLHLSARDYCDADMASYDQIGRIALPTFDVHENLSR